MRGLSPTQIAILKDIAQRTPKGAALNGVAVWAPSRGHSYAVPFSRRPPSDMTASERAVLSRSLARLEARGLVERLEGFDGSPRDAGRTKSVRLTELGISEVERLTKEDNL